jgi:hypothetical protein
VKAEKTYGSIEPISKNANTNGSTISVLIFEFPEYDLVIKPPNNDKETKAAEPIANPLPTAAVVLPAASNASVISLISGPS